MADPPSYPDSNGDTGDDITSTPRWVKVSGIIALVLVLLLVVIQFTGVGGGHGPSRHTPSGTIPPSGVAEHGVQRP